MSEVASLAVPEGVAPAAWDAIGARINADGRWETPERNADGEVIGWVERHEKANGGADKIAKAGSKRGLTFVPPLDRYAGSVAHDPICVVEGQTDTAAGLTAGLDVVGRPSVSGGAKLLCELLADLHICVILENDGKKPGKPGPGQIQGLALAHKLVGACASVRTISPPPGIKDLRAWIIAGATAKDIQAAATAVAPLIAPPETDSFSATDGATDGVGAVEDTSATKKGSRPCTDLGNAERLVARSGGDLRYCFPTGKWMVWNGKLWMPDESGAIMRRAAQTARSIYKEAAAAKDPSTAAAIGAWAKASESRSHLEAMCDLARSLPGVSVMPDQLDRDAWAFNCINGTIDLRTGALRPHRREDLISRMARVSFDAAATAPQWETFLDRIFGADAGLIRFVQQFLGICLTGDVTEQILVIFHGEGNNGKNVLLDAVAGIMGAYASQAAPDLLTLSKFREHPTEIADLLGRRLVAASETEEDCRLRLQLVKRMTGDARLKGRFMRGDFFEFDRTFKLVLMTNNLPEIRESSEAAWRRIRLVPFKVVIPEAERDPRLLIKLRAEWTGILAWLVRGCRHWLANGLSKPNAVVAATAKYRGEADHLGRFLAECCTEGAGLWTRSAALRMEYDTWCSDHGDRPLSVKAFPVALTRRGCSAKKVGGVRGWLGLEIRP